MYVDDDKVTLESIPLYRFQYVLTAVSRVWGICLT